MSIEFFDGELKYRSFNDERYFEFFFEEVLRFEIPYHLISKEISEFTKDDMYVILKKLTSKYKFQSLKYTSEYANSFIGLRHILVDCITKINEFEREIEYINTIDVSFSSHFYKIKLFLVSFYRELSLQVLHFVKDFDSVYQKTQFIDKSGKRIFLNKIANDWFLVSLNEKFDIEGNSYRGIGAFVKATLDNNQFRKYIFRGNITQKKLVEYLNSYYDKVLITNSTRLSDPKKYINDVNKLIEKFKIEVLRLKT